MLKQSLLTVATACALLSSPQARADTSVPSSIVTPEVVETSRGTFEFKDGAPS